MFFLQQGPAQTTNYMIAGYTVIFGVILLYVLSLFLRNRNLKRDLETLQELENKTNV
jgi:CcmD family protein